VDAHCFVCGAALHAENTCETHFHQMLAWEFEYPPLGNVHHLTVLCYHIQHPRLYSAEGLQQAHQLLREFVVDQVSPQEMRRKMSAQVDSAVRKTKIKSTATKHGVYAPMPHWTMTTHDVVEGGADAYIERVQAWAQRVLHDLVAAGYMSR
jgi:Family of unknown function (DUF5946)